MSKYRYFWLTKKEQRIAEELEKTNPWATQWDIGDKAREMAEKGKDWLDAKFETIK